MADIRLSLMPAVLLRRSLPASRLRGLRQELALSGQALRRAVEAYADEVTEQAVDLFDVLGRQRRLENCRDVAAHVLAISSPEHNHVDAGLVPDEPIGGFDHRLAAAWMNQEVERVGFGAEVGRQLPRLA